MAQWEIESEEEDPWAVESVEPDTAAPGYKPTQADVRRVEAQPRVFRGQDPYADKQEAIADAVNEIEVGADPEKVFAAFGKLGVTRDEIIAFGTELGGPKFAPDKRPVTVRDGAATRGQGALKKWETSTTEDYANFGTRVMERGRQARLGISAAVGAPEDYIARELADSAKRSAAAMPGEGVQAGMQAFGEAKTFGEAWEAIKAHPDAAGMVLAESAALFLPVMAAGVIAAPGAAAMAVGVGGFSGALEFGMALTEKLQDKGIDPRDVVAVEKALRDEAFMSEVREYGAKRGIAIGTIDALSAGIAGRFLNPALKAAERGAIRGRQAVTRVAAASVAEAAVQSGLGAGGEAAAQALTGEFKPADILFEAAGEIPGGAFEVASNVRAARKADPARQFDAAMQQDVAGRDFLPGPVAEYARRAMSPEFFDPNKVVPTGRTPPPIQLEDMPTRPFTADELGKMADAAPPAPDQNPIKNEAPPPVEAPAPTQEASPPAPAPSLPVQAEPNAVGVATVPQGALAAAAEAQLPQATQSPQEPAAPPVAPTPAPAAESAPVAPADALVESFRSADDAQAFADANGMGARTVPVLAGTRFALAPKKGQTKQDILDGQRATTNLARDMSAQRGRDIPLEAVPDVALPAGPVQWVMRVARAAFDVPVVAVRGLRAAGAFGVYHDGTTFVDAEVAGADTPMVFLHTVGHEARHLLERSKDAADAGIVAKLNSVVDAYTREGVVDKRRVAESIDPDTGVIPPGGLVPLEYAKNEVRADVNGAMWLDPEFWKQLYDIDKGSTFRRVQYALMRAVTKFMHVARAIPPGSRADIESFVTNVEAVRRASAEAWAARAKNKAARKKGDAGADGGAPLLSRRPPKDDDKKPDDDELRDSMGDELGAFSPFRNEVEPDEFDDVDVPESAYADDKEGKDKGGAKQSDGDKDKPELSDEEMADLQSELDEATERQSAMPDWVRAEIEDEFYDDGVTFKTRAEALAAGRPTTVDYEAVPDAAVKAAGFMPERAFPAPIWTEQGRTRQTALVKAVGATRTVETSVVYVDRGDVTAADYQKDLVQVGYRSTLSKPANFDAARRAGLPDNGLAIGGLTMTEDGAKSMAQRFIAGAELFARGFDLHKSIPAEAAKRVADAWKGIAKLPRAFEFGMLGELAGRSNRALAQRAADQLLAGTKFRASVRDGDSPGTVSVLMQKGDAAPGRATIEVTRSRPPRVIVHAANLDKGSSYGKPLYQIAAALADAVGGFIQADPDGLTAINTYRRTEHMLSSALRLGNAGTVNPGLGQRVYGWQQRPSGEQQNEANLVRLALAGARNAVELFPQIQELRYDLQSDRFYKADGSDGEPMVQAAMDSQNVQAASLSRSTMARAALTLQAIREGVDLTGVRELRTPVLYSRALPESHPHSLGFVSAVTEDAPTAVYSELAGRPIRYEVRIEDTGQVATVTVDGAAAMQELDRREQVTRQLLTCLAR